MENDGAAEANGSHRSAARAWLRALELTAPIAGSPHRILPVVIDQLGEIFGDAPALLSERESFTYRQLAGRSNRYARWALGQGLAKGDSVCLFMPNRPEYMTIWLGITRIGGIVSLLNTNLAGPSLAHCIDSVAPAHIIVAAELVDRLTTAIPAGIGRASIWIHGDGCEQFPRIDLAVGNNSGASLRTDECPVPSLRDQALNIYTSGTTGLPKAASVSHFRLMQWSHWFAGMMNTRPEDRLYNALPMYHSIGGVSAIGAVLVGGGSVVIRERFSASDFWNDVVRWNCTIFQYIGELCRYLLQSGPSAHERAHHLRMCCGNGLRPDVWDRFKTRFGIPQIFEFYAATEGVVSLFNVEGKEGAIGRVPPFLSHRTPISLVKFDVEKDEPVRNAQGRCVRCAPEEVGEAIAKVNQDSLDTASRFDGYSDAEAAEQKILREVFEPGDTWFRTGDLMRRDSEGYFYFIDRIGDTFRWKGENVAASEISETICAFPGVSDASAYGVSIPGTEGRAGMAALVAHHDLDLAALRAHLANRLPAYARPVFLRIQKELAVTSTFKHAKQDLMRCGYNPSASEDAIYFNDPERQAYVRLDQELFDRIQAGRCRL